MIIQSSEDWFAGNDFAVCGNATKNNIQLEHKWQNEVGKVY